MFKPLSLLAACSLLLAGCITVGPDYQRPALDLPTTLARPVAVTSSADNTDWRNWWKSFGDPVLNQLLDEAAAHSQDLLLAAGRIEEARATVSITDAERYPTVDAALSETRSRLSQKSGQLPPGVNPVSQVTQLGLSAAWEIDFWGKFRRADEAARARLLAQETNRGTVLSTLYASVAQNYFALRAYDAQGVLADAALKTRQDNLRLQQKRLNAGSIGALDMHQAESEVAAAEIIQAQARQSVSNTEAALAVLLGRSPAAISAPVIARGAPIDALYAHVKVPADLPADLVNRRPDILAAEQTLRAANADIGQARAAYFPTIKLTSGFGTASNAFRDLVSPASMLWNLGANLVQPVFRAGAIGALVSGAQARETQARAQYISSVQNAFKDVHDALTNLAASEQIYSASTRRATALTDSVRLATLRYDNGYSSYLDVLTAQRDLLQIQSNRIDAERSQLSALVGLYKALGGGWDKPQATMAR